MITSDRIGESRPRRHGRGVEQSVIGIFLVCLLMFVDVQLPLIDSSNRLIGLLILFLLIFGGRGIRTPFCATMAVLLPIYFLVQILLHDDVDAGHSWKVLIFQMLSLGGMVFVARAVASDDQRRKLTDMLVLFALASAVIASLQRFGILERLGRDRWADYTGRGVGLMADPNFLAVLLASVVPLIVSWRFTRLRTPALMVLALGLYSTNSRAGIFLALVALAVSMAGRMSTTNAAFTAKGRRSVTLVAICLVCLFAFNVGGQRDRAVEALLLELGIQNSLGTGDPTDAFVAHERRKLLESWVNLGVEKFPLGAGSGPSTELSKAAHNTFATLFGEGGIIGLAIVTTIMLCFVFFVRRRSEPFAVMGAVVLLGGLFLSYLGSVFLVIPMGLADGILAAWLGTRAQRAAESPPRQSERGDSPMVKRVEAP